MIRRKEPQELMRVIRNTAWSIAVALVAASALLTGCKAKDEVATTEVTRRGRRSR